MTQQVAVALIAAMAVLAGAILTLVGVLITTKVTFKLGKRTGDVAQQTADSARIQQLLLENQSDREEARKQWKENLELRRACDLAETQHQAEKDGWEAERAGWKLKVDALLRQVEAREAELRQKETLVGRAEAERDLAVEGQICAESGLSATLKTIDCIQSKAKENTKGKENTNGI